MQKITVDSRAQAQWHAQVAKAHARVVLSAIDAAGNEHPLISIGPKSVNCSQFEGHVASLKLELPAEERQTYWLIGLSPSELLHARVDGRGQLEVWSGDVPVAKWFDAEASPDEWPSGLLHATAGRVRDLTALLSAPGAVSLKSLGMGGASLLSDLSPLAGLLELASLNLSSCSQVTDLSPLAGLTQLLSLNLSGCNEVSDLRPLANLTQITSLNLGGCKAVTDLSPLAGLAQTTSLDLSNCAVSELAPLAGLTQLSSLDLGGCDELTDLTPLADLNQLALLNLAWCMNADLTTLRGLRQLSGLTLEYCSQLTDVSFLAGYSRLTTLNLNSCRRLTDLSYLAELKQLLSLNLSLCEQLTDLTPLAGLNQLTSIDLSGCGHLTDLSPLAGLSQVTLLNFGGCENLTDLSPLAGQCGLLSLELSGCTQLTDVCGLTGLTQLTSLDLSGCEQLVDLSGLAGLSRLTSLNLCGCRQLTDLKGLKDLHRLKLLDASQCVLLESLSGLAGTSQLARIDLSLCERLGDISALARLTELTSLNLSQCNQLTDLSSLRGLSRLTLLDLSGCERVVVIGPVASLDALSELKLERCANVRDIDVLAQSPSLSSLGYQITATRDSILLACATRRGDADLADRTMTSAGSFDRSLDPALHARRLVDAVSKLATSGNDLSTVTPAVAKAFRGRGEVPLKTWEVFLSTVVGAQGLASQSVFDAVLDDLALDDVECVLVPALLALADVPVAARQWALGMARQALAPVAASASHARGVAPAAAVFFHAHDQVAEVDAWMERGSVAQVPSWRDRVLFALLGRALRMDEIMEARRLLAAIQTPERRDEASAALARHLAGLARFHDAAKELDAIIDRARRASTASQALALAPGFAGDTHAGLSLLLALDGDPDTLADVLTAMVQQAPESELVRQVAAVFSPTQGVDLGRTVDALLASSSVTDRTKPKLLAGLRQRMAVDPTLARAALVHGTAALLAAEGLLDDDEAAEVTSELLMVAP